MSPAQNQPVHLALTPWNLTDDYNRHGGVTLLSFLDNCSSKVVAHLLYDPTLSINKLAEEQHNKSCYLEIAKRYDCEIVFHEITLPNEILELVRNDRHTPGTLLRLYLPELLPNVDKVIYLDCDIVVKTDIVELWNTPLIDKYIAACLDPMASCNTHKWVKYCESKNIPKDTYFNAGMIIMNLSKLRLETPPFSAKMISYLKEQKHLLLLDQDMLNWFCHGHYQRLDEKYNVFSARPDALKFIDDCIIHYNGSILKPWKIYSGKIDDPYWYYLSKTPWAENKDNLITYVRNAPMLEDSAHLLGNYIMQSLQLNKYSKIKSLINHTLNLWKPSFNTLLSIMRKDKL